MGKRNWKKRTIRNRKLLKKEAYYKKMLETYQPSSTGLSRTKEILHYYDIQVSEKNGGGQAIEIVLHFLLQNKVTPTTFDAYYKVALEYALKTLIRGRVYYDNMKGKSVTNPSDVEQLMRENLRASGVVISVREFMKMNSLAKLISSV